jgi:hypothetical protein
VAELLPPGAAIGGWAAARLQGAVEFDGRGRSGMTVEPVPVVLPPPMLVRARPGMARWRSALDPGDCDVVHGITCTSPLRTAFDLARRRSLREAVVALDQLGRLLCVNPHHVRRYGGQHRGWRGVAVVRRAVPLCDPRARSTGETRLRLIWVLDADLPLPEVNPSIYDEEGRLLGISDLLDPSLGLVGEYDGAGHREADRHTLDNHREEGLEDAGLIVVRATSIDVGLERRRTAARLVGASRRAQRQQGEARRWTWRPEPPPC